MSKIRLDAGNYIKLLGNVSNRNVTKNPCIGEEVAVALIRSTQRSCFVDAIYTVGHPHLHENFTIAFQFR